MYCPATFGTAFARTYLTPDRYHHELGFLTSDNHACIRVYYIQAMLASLVGVPGRWIEDVAHILVCADGNANASHLTISAIAEVYYALHVFVTQRG